MADDALLSANSIVDENGALVPISVGGLTVGGHVVPATAIHDWSTGWTPFTTVDITADGAQAFTQGANNGQGSLTGTIGTNPALRRAYLMAGTVWTDSEMTSLVLPPTGWTGTEAQQGHIHRVRQITSTQWEGIAIWTSIVSGLDYRTLHIRGVRFDGVTLDQSDGDAADASDATYIDRGMHVRAYERFTFGSVFQAYRVIEPEYLLTLEAGDMLDVIEMTDTSFNESSVAANTVDFGPANINLIDPAAGGAVTLTHTGNGRVLPDSNLNQKRQTPHWMSTRVRGTSPSSQVVEVKRWRPEDPEPDWSDARVKRRTILANAGVPTLATGPGHCALWGAHFINTSSGTWGGLRFRKL